MFVKNNTKRTVYKKTIVFSLCNFRALFDNMFIFYNSGSTFYALIQHCAFSKDL